MNKTRVVANTLNVEQVDREVAVAMDRNSWRRSLYSMGSSTPLTEGCINRQISEQIEYSLVKAQKYPRHMYLMSLCVSIHPSVGFVGRT